MLSEVNQFLNTRTESVWKYVKFHTLLQIKIVFNEKLLDV